jgi:hypothetical protein
LDTKDGMGYLSQKYPLPAFRAQLYKYKTLNGLMVDDAAAGGGTAGGDQDGGE